MQQRLQREGIQHAQHITCQTDELDAAVAAWCTGGDWRITHVVSPDFREGVKEWHLFLERT